MSYVANHSKWLPLWLMTIFPTRLPDAIVSGSWPTFCSGKFWKFLWNSAIQHTKSLLYHPSSNVLAERAFQTLKSSIKSISFHLMAQRSAGIFSSLPFTALSSDICLYVWESVCVHECMCVIVCQWVYLCWSWWVIEKNVIDCGLWFQIWICFLVWD